MSEEILVKMSQASESPRANQETLRQHIREIKERHKLPSPPVVVTKVINMLKNPDFNVRELSRVIADDPSLASKTLSMSRSPRYAQRFQPKTVHEAILVLGLQTLRNIVVAAAAASFLSRKNKISEKLWTHSLAVALAARIVAKRVEFADPEMAFLTGLLHDVGEMVLFNSDPRGFEQIVEESEQAPEMIVKKEAKRYGFDHTAVGVALLDFWKIEEEVAEAVLIHHKGSDNAVGSLAAIIDMADYLCAQADLGFFSELPNPGAEMISASGCEDEPALEQLVQEVRDAFQEESFLFREA
jgi:putative nucleotidyltransferase with HDIG domain